MPLKPRKIRKKVIDAQGNLPVREKCNHDFDRPFVDDGIYTCALCGEDITVEYLAINSDDETLAEQLKEVLKDNE